MHAPLVSETMMLAAAPVLAGMGTAADHTTAGTVMVVAALAASVLAVLWLRPRTRWLVPVVVPMVAGALLGLSGHAVRAVAVTGLGLLALGLLVAGVDVQPHVQRAALAVGAAIAVTVSTALFLVTVVPAWATSKVRRRDPLRPLGSVGTTWVKHPTNGSSPSSLAAAGDAVATRRSLVGRISWGLGATLLVLGTNYGVGWAWDRATDRSGPDTVALTVAPASGGVERDPRNDLPSMAAYPWRERYFADIQRTRYGYWPFTEGRPMDFKSPYVNVTGWRRATWEPRKARRAMPSLWMFGGSTTWGEGQRDGYTIASWISRLAARDGVPVKVDNYGQRGWTHFQEMVLYEQQLAARADPDLAVFYDGANEVNTQSLMNEAVPSHTLAAAYAQRLGFGGIQTTFLQQPTQRNVLGDLWHAYSEHSALHKVAYLFRSSPAGATPAQDGPGAGFTPGQQDADGATTDYAPTVEDGRDAGQVYERGQLLTRELSRRHRVDALYFWQPVRFDGPPQQAARAKLTKPTIDIHDALDDHPEVYIDGGHTNEEGARIVAERIWTDLEPRVRTWYRER